jgi:hypothetical protein
MAIGMDTEDIGNITTTGTYLFRPDPLRSHTNVARSSGNHLNTMFKRPGKPLGRFSFASVLQIASPKPPEAILRVDDSITKENRSFGL